MDNLFNFRSLQTIFLKILKLDIISRLRSDSVLQYLYLGEKTGERGRPKNTMVKLIFTNLTRTTASTVRFKIVHQDKEKIIFSAIIFAKSLKRKIKLALVQYLDENTGKIKTTKIYFSTDLDLSAWHIVWFYGLRFQIEFIYRDAN